MNKSAVWQTMVNGICTTDTEVIYYIKCQIKINIKPKKEEFVVFVWFLVANTNQWFF